MKLVLVSFISWRLSFHTDDSSTRVRISRLISAGTIDSANSQRQESPNTSLTSR